VAILRSIAEGLQDLIIVLGDLPAIIPIWFGARQDLFLIACSEPENQFSPKKSPLFGESLRRCSSMTRARDVGFVETGRQAASSEHSQSIRPGFLIRSSRKSDRENPLKWNDQIELWGVGGGRSSEAEHIACADSGNLASGDLSTPAR